MWPVHAPGFIPLTQIGNKKPGADNSGRAMCLKRNEPDLNYAIRMRPISVKY